MSNAPVKPKQKFLEEIILSKSTFAYGAPMPLIKRIGWLRYELPASMSLSILLPSTVFPIIAIAGTMASRFSGYAPIETLLHPEFLLTLVLTGLTIFLLLEGLVLAAAALYLVNPKEFMNLFVYPDLIGLRDDAIELSWTKLSTNRTSLLDAFSYMLRRSTVRTATVPWSWISSVRVRDYLYMGVTPQKVLEIELSEIPARRGEWKLLAKLSRDGSYFFDPVQGRMAKKFALSGIRIPLPLFAFSSDLNKLIDYCRLKCGEEIVDDQSLALLGAESGNYSDNNDSSEIESYTCLWLQELNTKNSHDLRRQLPIGTKLQDGTFEIADVLGAGGFSVVYRANELAGSNNQVTPVAIKEILCNFGGTKQSVENNLKQILTEVSLLRSLNHPHIVRYKSFFVEGTRLYVVMDLINGVNLRQYTDQNAPLAEAELLALAKQCSSILAYLHGRSKPLLHRDFTPDNLMLEDGVVKVVDFNISQSALANTSNTVMGKHCFMAPEQFCGDSSAASDLYQLGTTIYYLATGLDPEPLTPCEIQRHRPEISDKLNQLVRALTERDPSKRPPSAMDVTQRIEAISHSAAHAALEVK